MPMPCRKYSDSKDVLDRLIPLLGDDPREVRGLLYLEAPKISEGSVMLEKLTGNPSMPALPLPNCFSTGRAPPILLSSKWPATFDISPEDPLRSSYIYLQLLNPELPYPSTLSTI